MQFSQVIIFVSIIVATVSATTELYPRTCDVPVAECRPAAEQRGSNSSENEACFAAARSAGLNSIPYASHGRSKLGINWIVPSPIPSRVVGGIPSARLGIVKANHRSSGAVMWGGLNGNWNIGELLPALAQAGQVVKEIFHKEIHCSPSV
ncbi:hypothetical protein BU17DRAFT_70568 [Hysterangium stoloniferum]|nr:hypothetical protein BU17DRAFT_70568 [Hysterangium stoloniferum]